MPSRPPGGSARPAPTAHDLWRLYRADRERSVRDRLVLALAPLVRHVVGRAMGESAPRCELDDLLSCGFEALLGAIERFDPERGATLEQFVWTRVHGAVLDERRRLDWAPRAVRRWEREIVRTEEDLAAGARRTPETDLAAALGIDADALRRHRQEVAAARLASLNVPVHTEAGDLVAERIDALASTDQATDPEHATFRAHARAAFRDAFARLSSREREIAVLLYAGELTLREIGQRLGVTESRICQLHGQLRRSLRADLEADASLLEEVA